ncbi:MFS transporter [Chloroflexota bacterium]
MVVAACFIIGTAIWGVRFSFGVFFKSIESEFILSRATTSSIFSTQLFLGGLFTIFGGWLLDRHGPRIVFLIMGLSAGLGLLLTGQTNTVWQLFITYSLLLAIGTSAVYVGIASTAVRWFDKRRGLALGLASIGGGLGPMITAPFVTYLITNYDWRMAFTVMGLLIWLTVIPLSRLLKRDPYEIGVLPDGVKKPSSDTENKSNYVDADYLSLGQALRTRSFWLVVVISSFFASSLLLVLTHLVPHTLDIGFSVVEAATVLSLTGGSAIIGRLLLGTASDKIGRRTAVIICTLLHAGAMVWLIWAKELWMLYLFALLFGLGWGGMGPTMAVLIGDTFGLGKMGTILGVMEFGFSTGAALGPIIGGLIFDITQSYVLAFSLEAAAVLIATLLLTQVRRETKPLELQAGT